MNCGDDSQNQRMVRRHGRRLQCNSSMDEALAFALGKLGYIREAQTLAGQGFASLSQRKRRVCRSAHWLWVVIVFALLLCALMRSCSSPTNVRTTAAPTSLDSFLRSLEYTHRNSRHTEPAVTICSHATLRATYVAVVSDSV